MSEWDFREEHGVIFTLPRAPFTVELELRRASTLQFSGARCLGLTCFHPKLDLTNLTHRFTLGVVVVVVVVVVDLVLLFWRFFWVLFP